MYDNIGGKIKVLAKAFSIVVAIISIITGIVVLINDMPLGISLFLILAVPIIAWISSFVLYGFGELIEDIGVIRREKVGSTSSNKTYTKNKSYTEPKSIQEQEKTFNKNNSTTPEINKCEHCGKESHNVHRRRMTGTGGWANLCDECAEKY